MAKFLFFLRAYENRLLKMDGSPESDLSVVNQFQRCISRIK